MLYYERVCHNNNIKCDIRDNHQRQKLIINTIYLVRALLRVCSSINSVNHTLLISNVVMNSGRNHDGNQWTYVTSLIKRHTVVPNLWTDIALVIALVFLVRVYRLPIDI